MENDKKEEALDNTPLDVLDQVKKIERAKKQRLLAKNIEALKRLARSVKETKAKMNVLLELLGISPEDGKRVIDFLNELEETRITEEDEKLIREQTKKGLAEDKKTVEKDLEGTFKAINEAINANGTFSAGFCSTASPGIMTYYNNNTANCVGVPAVIDTGARETMREKLAMYCNGNTNSVKLCAGNKTMEVKI